MMLSNANSIPASTKSLLVISFSFSSFLPIESIDFVNESPTASKKFSVSKLICEWSNGKSVEILLLGASKVINSS